jgi:general secretion pathway protein A
MFLNHFQFTAQPFAERVSAVALWQDDRMQQGLARLRYLAEQATVALVTGASGVGKSALLKRFLLHELHGPRWQPVYLHLTHLPAAGLLKLLVGKLGELPRRGKERLFEQILGKARQAEGSLLVVPPPLKIVLAGQEPLRQTLRQSLHADLLNRISVRFHLAPLSKEQTASYIDFQLKQAGGSEKLFDPAAKNLIHDYSGGVPRQINNLATACLLQAAAQNATRISEAMLQQTLSEFQLP